ncbi:SAM-dependent chlorinase/fluorinase [Nitrospirillum sp. BR 11163]|uniref:SAM hydrolase/SAM-dependent halogenase family protein n=1 Tax=Nitrospirillum sp. BR 11163 TaxID=3104323 RepID=UPI002AFDD228|nr:SAM-dependent chlorinase/fluorinase [Nitrospirillum sp. BR 11163]MEA1677777.1 SAM-dependent chlorinase/fluorinase [Nitrospirillum sp. BR 11163]
MIFLYTDFGWSGPYVGQMRAVLTARAPVGTAVIDLMHDAPAFDPLAAGRLLAAILPATLAALPHTTVPAVFLAVVDPGVGTGRRPLALRLVGSQGRPVWLVGPDNGLFQPVIADTTATGGLAEAWEITWRPDALSASFHGRDLFAPVAALVAEGRELGDWARPLALTDLMGAGLAGAAPMGETGNGGAADNGRILYIDSYGNGWTGLRPAGVLDGTVAPDARLWVGGSAGGRAVEPARTFGAVPRGAAFWYVNSSGLVEIAVNQGRADDALGFTLGSPIGVRAPYIKL